jgi:hypothetical protein
MNPCFKAALEYINRGISVIPVGKDKKPLISWKEFQSRRPEPEEIIGWFETFPEAQVGIVTGEISGITVVDIEKGGDTTFLPQETSVVSTGGGGFHYYYKFEPGTYNTARTRPLTDTRSEGGYVIAPPSVSDKGPYALVKKLPLLQFPLELFGGKKEEKKSFQNAARDTLNGVGEVGRNQSAAQVIGLLVCYLPERYWGRAVWPLAQAWNNNNVPPLPEEELFITYNSICNKQRFNKK